jgi:glycosyltransferase involved in cell wall biosynthesis
MFRYSVVIPAYNAAETIRQAIESVLDQTIGPQQVIVVDDGSTDGTSAVVDSMASPVTLVSQANRGPGAATNAGIARVETPFWATLDADDLWLPNKIERQAECFEREPSIAGVFSLARQFRDGTAPHESQGAVRRMWTRTTMLYRSQAAREVGDFVDLSGHLGEVIDWLTRGRDLGHRHVMVEEILAFRRVRPGSLSHSIDAAGERGYLLAIRRALARKKQMQDAKGAS